MKYKFNYNKLKQFIKESVFTIEDICQLIGLPTPTYYFQVRNSRLSVVHLLAIADLLNLTEEQLMSILKGEDENE